MLFVRQSRFMGVTNALLAILLVMVAGRADASCFSAASRSFAQEQPMENCTEMKSVGTGDQHSDHSNQQQAGACQLGCMIVLKGAEAPIYPVSLYNPRYLPEIGPPMVGLNAIPQTPPPRFI
jgi:hypothetical protein